MNSPTVCCAALAQHRLPALHLTHTSSLALPEFEDEVPAVLKLLGYPNNISRSALASVGAPHAWPPILAALSWLVDLLKYSEAVQMAESDPNNDWASDGDAGERMFFEYLAKGYALFLKGEDDLSPLEEQIAFTFESKNASLRSDIQSLSAANEELSNEHKGYTEGPTPLQYAKAQNADFKSDQAKFEKHIADLHEHRKKVTARLAGLQAECTERQTELAGLMQEITMHKETIAAQELTPTDVERMHSEKEHLEAELSGLAKQKDTLAKQLWEEELATSRAVDRLETKVQQANNCSLRLHLIPKSAKNAKGYNHEISLNKSKLTADPSALVGPLDSAGHLQPSLQRVKAATAAEVTQAQDALLESESALTRRDEQSQERAEQLASLKAQLAKLEREEKELRDEHAAELAERKAETERLEEMIRKAKSANGQEVTASSNELQSLQKEFDDFTSHAAAARERMYSQLVSSIDMLTLHKENIENQLAGLKKHCSAKMDQLQTAIEIS